MALAMGLTARALGVLLATAPSQMTRQERLFCVIAYWPKVTVQAALVVVALGSGIAEGQLILAIAVLSILITAPLGLIGINLSAQQLLAFQRPWPTDQTRRVSPRLPSFIGPTDGYRLE